MERFCSAFASEKHADRAGGRELIHFTPGDQICNIMRAVGRVNGVTSFVLGNGLMPALSGIPSKIVELLVLSGRLDACVFSVCFFRLFLYSPRFTATKDTVRVIFMTSHVYQYGVA
jgi:hypothetical protein